MKNLLIIYNIIFLVVGNFLFSNIHYIHHHDHNHAYDYNNHECQDCINIENSNNYVSYFQEIKFSNNKTSLFINEYFSIIKTEAQDRSLSRAPPIS